MPAQTSVTAPAPTAGPVPPADALTRVPTGVLLINLTAVGVPFLGLIVAVALLWGWGFGWSDLGLLLGMYVLTGLGITVGFHRLFTHRSFETNRVVQFILAALGSMAVEGSLLQWVAVHRRHHQYSDAPGDPHSPHLHGWGIGGLLRGLWHAHVGWVFRPDAPDLARYVTDLRQSRTLRAASALFPVWVGVGLLIPTVLGAVLTGTWTGAILGLLWGGLARICLVHHVTWSINSICHLWGQRTFRTDDQSRNNLLLGVLGLGEGWHNNHHAFPTSARYGLRWWQTDAGYLVIRALALVGLARQVKGPTRPTGAGQGA